MMTRIAPASPPYAPAVAEDLSALMPPGLPPIALFRTMAKNPRVLHKLRLGNLLDRGSLSLHQRELVILRTSALCDAEYEWGVHALYFAPKAGLDAAQLYATKWLGPDAACWQPEDALLIRLCDQLHQTSRVSDALWAELRAGFGEDQLLELLTLAGFYHTIAYILNGAQVELEPRAPRFPTRDGAARAGVAAG